MKRLCKRFALAVLLCCTLCVGASAAEDTMLKVGLKCGSEAMSEAKLQNYSAFGGYALGYYDAQRSFVQLAALPASCEKITMTADNTYHPQLGEAYSDYASAAARAAQFSGAFAAWDNGAYVVRVGSYGDYASAQSALYAIGGGGTVAGGSGTGVTVSASDTSVILFEFDGGSALPLGIRPIETGEKTVTWFRGYRYYGGFEYRRADGGLLNVINVVDLEDYVKCVIPWEMNSDWPVEALKAQAVCARTYAACQRKHAAQGYDVCASTHCQVYRGTAKCSAYSDAAAELTAGQYLRFGGQIVKEALYCSSNGGASEDSVNVWGSDEPYLKGKADPYEAHVAARVPKYNWSTTYTAAELTNLLSSSGYRVGSVKNVYISALTDMGNVYSLTFTGTLGSVTVTKETCRTLLNLRSQRFSINGAGGESYAVNEGGSVAAGSMSAIDGSGKTAALSGGLCVITADGTASLGQSGQPAAADVFVFSGSGNGHNVGMSQWGAYAMADLGYSYRDILQFYYTGVAVG